MGLRIRLLLFILSFSSFSALKAQLQLSGKVINESNMALAGATVNVSGSGMAAKILTTDVEGRFLVLVPAGEYTVTVSYVGYDTKEISNVMVGENLDNTITVVMLPAASAEMGAVVIRSTRRQESTAALLAFQKNNSSLSSGLAADFIRRTPDKNTGEVLKRVSGTSIQDNRFVIIRGLSDRYNAALINNAQLPSTEPDKKAFSFDVLPSVLVDNIIINKTATPEFPGEFAGGLVQINTKDIPSKDVLSVRVSLGYNTRSTFKDFISNPRNGTDWIGFDNGTRSLPSGFPSTTAEYRNLNSTEAGRQLQLEYSRQFNNDVYRQVLNTALPSQTYNITWGNNSTLKNDAKFGSIISLIYRNSMLIYEVDRQLNNSKGDINAEFTDQQNRYNVNAGVLANFAYVKGKHKISFKNLFNQLFDDNYYIRSGESIDRQQDISFRSSFLNQRMLYSTQLEGDHQVTQSGVKLRWNLNGSFNWKKQPDLRTVAYNRAIGSTNEFDYNDDDTRRFFSDLKDFAYGANGAVSVPFEMSGRPQTAKFGGSTLLRVRDFNSRLFRYEPRNFSTFDGSKATLSYDEIFAPENISNEGFFLNEYTNPDDKYFGASVLNGMFAMLDNKLGEEFRLVWGVRVENFQQFLTTRNKSNIRQVVHTEKWDLLPSFNLTWSLAPRQNLRIAGSRTVSRPEFREIAPFAFYDYEATYGVVGNPMLKRGAIINGDIRYEIYPRGGEAISLGVFYKRFDDPIELRIDAGSVPDRRIYFFDNADEAYTMGAELEVRKGLDFLGTSMENFDVFANLTYSFSEVTLSGTGSTGEKTSDDRPLQGQSPYLINIGLQYAAAESGWNGSLLYNRVGERLALVGDLTNTGIASTFERPRNQLDFQIGKRILDKKAELKLTVSDILNSPYYFYDNYDGRNAFSKSGDELFYTFRPGTTISVGFSYDFSL